MRLKLLHEIFYNSQFKYKIATLRIVTIEIFELTFLLILYFHVVTKGKRRSHLASKPIYYTKKWFSKNLLGIDENKPIYLGMSMLEISKTVIHGCSCDYIKTKYGSKANLCYMDTDTFIVSGGQRSSYARGPPGFLRHHP